MHFHARCMHARHIVMHACLVHLHCICTCTSTSHEHYVTVENVLFKVQNSHRKLFLYWRCHVRTLLGCLSVHATPEVCHVQCTEIITEQSVCGATLVLLQTVGWSILAVNLLTAASLAGQCCTRRLKLLFSLFHPS